MAINGKYFLIRNVIGNYRNLLCNRSFLPTCQHNAGLKQSVEEKLGIPLKPKKPLTPYFRFMAQLRPGLVKKNPDAKVTDIVRLVAQQWENVDPTVRQKLETEYKKDMTEYSTTRLKYDQSLTNEQREDIKRFKIENEETKEKRILKKKKKELGKPTKPPTGFLAFMQAKQSTRGDMPFKDWQTGMAKQWEGLAAAEKARYLAEGKRAMEGYKRELQEWEEKMIRLGHIDVVRNEALIQPKAQARPRQQAHARE